MRAACLLQWMGVKLSNLKVFKSCKSHFVGMQLTMYMLTNINTSLEILHTEKKERAMFLCTMYPLITVFLFVTEETLYIIECRQTMAHYCTHVGKENPDLPSVCSNYWPPNVAQFVF